MYLDLDELKAAAPIIPFIKQRYPNLKICEETSGLISLICPWHKEKSPSLKVFANGSFKCFGGGCGEHGDIVNFVEKMENVDFEDACRIIGEEVGYEVNFEPPNKFHEAYKNTMDNHARRYWYNLQMNQYALDYLDSRGISKETRDEFRLGLTDAKEYKYRKDLGSIQNRISFPILEPKNIKPKCIAMTYRTLDDSILPKYINDRNQDGSDGKDKNLTGVFIKGECLYGYSQAYKAIKKSGYAILTEGPMDVISMHQAGIKNIVGSLGTSVTAAQIKLLSKITNNLLLTLDGDSAGIKAAIKIIPMILSEGMNVSICVLPNGLDLANICTKNNFNENIIRKVIKESTTPAVQYLINEEIKNYETFVIRERIKVIENLSSVLDVMTNQAAKNTYLDMIYKRLDIRR